MTFHRKGLDVIPKATLTNRYIRSFRFSLVESSTHRKRRKSGSSGSTEIFQNAFSISPVKICQRSKVTMADPHKESLRLGRHRSDLALASYITRSLMACLSSFAFNTDSTIHSWIFVANSQLPEASCSILNSSSKSTTSQSNDFSQSRTKQSNCFKSISSTADNNSFAPSIVFWANVHPASSVLLDVFYYTPLKQNASTR